MTLFYLGPLYVGLAKIFRYDFWCTYAAVHIHIGRLRIEWDRRIPSNGSAQKASH